jgi:hypothetical protein
MSDVTEANLQASLENRLSSAIDQDPIANVAFASLAAIVNCGIAFKQTLRCATEEETSKLLLLACFEYMYFFLFAASRVLERRLLAGGTAQTERLQLLITNLLVDTFLMSLPLERKSKLLKDVDAQIRETRSQYDRVLHADSGGSIPIQALTPILANRLASLLSDSQIGTFTPRSVLEVVKKEWDNLDIEIRITPLIEG